VSFVKGCGCCGSTYWLNTGEPDPGTCKMCERREGLCQHNLFTRVAEGGENMAYSSRPEPTIVRLRDGLITREEV
jgi:hypothetical protein